MSQEEPEFVIRRILVALDASPHSRAALQAAVELAARLEAEVLGMFVEDINLLRLAELSLGGEVVVHSATRRELDARQLERELRAQAVLVRRALARMAQRARIQWDFRVVRGVVASELLNAASSMDLIILGRVGRSLVPGRRLGTTARAVLSGATCLALILQYGSRLGMPILVVYDDSPLGSRALSASIALAQKGRLTVLILAGDRETAERLRERAERRLQGQGVQAEYRSLTSPAVPRLAESLQAEECGVLVLPAEGPLLRDAAVMALLEEIEIPVLLVR